MNTASHSMKRRKRSFSHFCYFLSKILSLRSKFKALEVIAGEKNCSNIYPIVFSFISIGKNIRILQSQLMNFGALCFNPGPLCGVENAESWPQREGWGRSEEQEKRMKKKRRNCIHLQRVRVPRHETWQTEAITDSRGGR